MMMMMMFQDAPEPSAAPAAEGSLIGTVIYLAVYALLIVSMWKTFVKAGKPGWASIVPLYNVIVLLQIADKPLWYVALGPIGYIVAAIGVAKKFGRGTGFGLGMVFLPFVFWPMLAFGSAKADNNLAAQPA